MSKWTLLHWRYSLVATAGNRIERSRVPILKEETVREAAIEISRLPEREKRLVLGIVRQFGGA